MNVAAVLEQNKELAPIFFAYGMGCLGCVMARGENIEQACAAHGIDVDALVKALNEASEGEN